MNRPRGKRHRMSCQQLRDDLWDMHMDRPLLAYAGHLQHCAACKSWFEEQVAVMRQRFPMETELGTRLGTAVGKLLVAQWEEARDG